MISFGMSVGELPDEEEVMKKPIDAEAVFSNFSNSRPKQMTVARKSSSAARPVIVEVRKSRKLVKPT